MFMVSYDRRHGESIENPPPLDRFTHLQCLRLHNIKLRPETIRAIHSLPMLRELTLVYCLLDTEAELQLTGFLKSPRSLLKLDLILPKVTSDSASVPLLRSFKNLRSLKFITTGRQPAYILRALVTHNLAVSLTSIAVDVNTEEAVTLLLSVLHTSPNIKTIDLCKSNVNEISVPVNIIPLLDTFKGPPHLALPFVKGRRIHTVVFWERTNGLEGYLNVLEKSCTSIRTFVAIPRAPWTEAHTWLLIRYAPNLLKLEINSHFIEVGLISK